MDVALWVWFATVGGVVAVLSIDLFVFNRRPRAIPMKEAGAWVAVYVTLALLFGLGILVLVGPNLALEFFAGYITEYSLSVDNLFVFLLIISSFGVPRENQPRVILVGIVLALVFRGAFIAAGAAAISAFGWVFYIFGAFLIYTAIQLTRQKDEDEEEYGENVVIRYARKVLPTTDRYVDARLTTVENGRRVFTPMLLVMAAIGTTDIVFALDSIPAIFGLTQEAYLVFTANAFALMGLRQLYFLLGGLLERLVYLSYGLAVILGFIGVKLIVEELHRAGFHWAPEVPIWFSLGVIVVTLTVTTVASLVKARRDPSAGRPRREEESSREGQPAGRVQDKR